MFDVFYLTKKPFLFPHEQKVDSIEEAQQRSRTRFFWIVNYLADYQDFDFLWEPVPWERHQRHAWPSQWQKDSGTYLIPKSGYDDTNYRKERVLHMKPDMDLWEIPSSVDRTAFDWSWHPDYSDPPFVYQFPTQWQKTGGPRYPVPGATDIKYTDQLRVITKPNAQTVYFIDHMNPESADVMASISSKLSVAKSVRYFDNYLDILKRIAKNATNDGHEHIWICSSICDYTSFDFTWHPETWQGTMLHVFPSNDQKFGDTFYMHVPSFVERMNKVELLEWYDCNFLHHAYWSVQRFDPVRVQHDLDSHADAVKTYEFQGPLAVFANSDLSPTIPTVNLWRPSTKTIVPLTKRASVVVVPKQSIPEIKTQLYDYPHIDKTYRKIDDRPLDIVFISNGESGADLNWERLQQATGHVPNRVVRVDGVKGRANAYRAALDASETPWAFCVFAKLEVNMGFDWTWQPDCMQQPKHYIFHALNPVNDLVYGHMAMIAYNKKLVMENQAQGLDFTLDQAHEVVPIDSGVAYFASDPWMAWRTAFREALKLRHSLPDVENEYRLKQWLEKGKGQNGEWSIRGAQDAVEYYEQVNGDFEQLRKSYEWEWLASYALFKRDLIPGR